MLITFQVLNAKALNIFHYHGNSHWVAHKDSHCFGKDFEAVSGQQKDHDGPLAMPSVGARRTRGSTFHVFTILEVIAYILISLRTP